MHKYFKKFIRNKINLQRIVLTLSLANEVIGILCVCVLLLGRISHPSETLSPLQQILTTAILALPNHNTLPPTRCTATEQYAVTLMLYIYIRKIPFRIWPRLNAIPGLFRELLQFVEANIGLSSTFREIMTDSSKL
jgi:hypothetical protein